MKDSDAVNMQWWNEFARACEEIDPAVYLVGEAWDESDPLAQYTQPFDTKINFTFAQDLVEAVKREQAIAESYDTGNTEILGFYRKNKQEKLLVLHNFSGETVTMDCSMEGGGKVIYGSKQKDTKKVG